MALIVKTVLYRILIPIILVYELVRFFPLTILNRKIVVFDLDNTLVDTAAIIKKGKTIDFAWQFASCNIAIKSKLINYVNRGYKIVILSARPYNKKQLSKAILESNSIPYDLLIHSSSVAAKVIFYFISIDKIIVYDDLSYGEETGEVMFFKSQIQRLTNWKKIEYHGYYDIKKLIERFDENEGRIS
jgi:hypothetical protein